MKRFPLKILLVSILLPPICYILTLQVLENYFHRHEESQLNQILIQNDEALYEGRYTVKEEINRNIEEYLSRCLKCKLGVKIDILVKTKDDRILYPSQFEMDHKNFQETDGFSEFQAKNLNYVEVSVENYKILNDGLTLLVNVEIKYYGLLSSSIIIFYVLVFVLIVHRFIKKGIRETERQEVKHETVIRGLTRRLRKTENGLKAVKANQVDYSTKIAGLKKEKSSLSKDVDALLEEIEKLEEGLDTQKDLKEATEYEVLELREELDRLQGKLQQPKKKKKKVATTGKRFQVLYKNLVFTERAIIGFLSLTSEFQLKAEEVIHRLNEDQSLVSIKRRVFGKGGKMNILEVDFSYSGRLYFQQDDRPKTNIVAIGTKNTQDQDLAYLESIR
ncbi:MAG: hypothetical protein JRE23_09545 [Deltaproteobacteria bacterium]|nr:hypothetical protein [Deltaproteobacteria bacterium]